MNMAQWLLLALLSLPILELYMLIQVGGILGFMPTLSLLFGAATLGTYLLRTQGLSTYTRVQECFARGELPAGELISGAVILLGAALLLLPGFISDVLGLLCLIPATRQMIIAYWIKYRFGLNPMNKGNEPKIIEGEYRRED